MSAAIVNRKWPQSVSEYAIRPQRQCVGQYRQPASVHSCSPLSVTPWPDAVAYRSASAGRQTGDERQAAYFFDLLTQHLRRIDRRIGRCRVAIVDSEVAGDIENINGFRLLLGIEELEREAVADLIANLRLRFSLPDSR